MKSIKKLLFVISLLFLILPLGACASKKDFFVQFYVSGELIENMYFNCGEVVENLPEYEHENITIIGWYNESTGMQIKPGTIVAENMIVTARTSYQLTKDSDTWLDKSLTDEIKRHYQIKVSTAGTFYLNKEDINTLNNLGIYSYDFTESAISDNTFPQLAFANNEKVKKVLLPLSTTAIGQSAFYNCTNLLEVVMNNNLRVINSNAFYNCDSLTEITLPTETTIIDNFAFAECSNLSILNIGSKATAISSNFVDGAVGLKSINVFNNDNYFSLNGILYLKEFGLSEGSETTTHKLVRCPEGKSGNVSIFPKTGKILESSFKNCKNITKVNLANDVNLLYEIKKEAFYNCTNLSEVVLSDTLKSIGASAFENCYELKKINFLSASDLSIIGDYAFKNCDSLTSIVFGDSLTSIGKSAFYDCDKLVNVQIGTIAANESLNIGDFAFYKNLYLHDFEFLILGDNVPTLGSLTFGNAMPFLNGNNPNKVKVYINNISACLEEWSSFYTNIEYLLYENE